MNFSSLTVKQASNGLKAGDFSSIELTKESLKQISALEKKIHAFLNITKDLAKQTAKDIDKNEDAKLSMISGIPAGIKDVLMTKGVVTTAGAKILEDYRAVYDATAVAKLKQQGMIIMGKNNCDEFAMGSSTENSAYGPTYNPWDLSRVPGGSSGGGAAAVASGEVLYALGTDTGGSIRQPAAFCGVVGLKPTYGLVSRFGLIAMASSLDSIGCFTKTVEDSAILLENIAGPDKKDATTINTFDYNFRKLLNQDINGLKIGLPKEYFVKGLDREIEQIVKQKISELVAEGAEVKEVSLPHTEYALPVYYILMPAEVSSNLSKFDGLRYGQRTKQSVDDLLDYYMKTRHDGFGDESRRRILLGTYVLSSGYIDEYYLQAQRVRTKIIEDFDKVFKQVDVLISPTTPTTAFKIGEKIDDPVSMYLSDIYTVAVNLAGLPAISLPVGLSNHLPVGLQIIGPKFSESKILQVGSWLEKIRGEFLMPKV